jgi:hypothetical protein
MRQESKLKFYETFNTEMLATRGSLFKSLQAI